MALEENTNYSDRLEELGGSDYEIVDGQPNIKGWDVVDTAGHDVGEVDELIFDKVSRKVLYLVVDLDDNELNLESRKVLVPIGLATLHEKNDEVILAELSARQLGILPEYEEGKITPAVESTIRNTFTGLAAAIAGGATSYESHPEGFYEHEHFDQNRFYDSRHPTDATTIPIIEESMHIDKKEVETGGARITSKIVERPVEENITLSEEHVFVDRTPVDRIAAEADFQTFKEGTIELTESKEVPVVSKQAWVVEEVKIIKTVSEAEHTISETVRVTEVDTEKIEKDETRNDLI